MDYTALAELLFPDVHETPEDVLRRHPPRDLPEGAIVTRFAPSPTGFIHIGSIYASQVARMLALQSGGVFILRIEDTDQERKLERGIEEIVESLLEFGVPPDEGPYTVDPLAERGAYGPYQQSLRRNIYRVFAKELVRRGFGYPSFQTPEEIDAIRKEQQRQKAKPGYYGPWAKDRNLSYGEVKARLGAGQPFAVRYRAEYPAAGTVKLQDAIRGTIEMPANEQDHILLKSDGLPTYHFAHAVDEPTMRVNLVLRADEWLATWPLHVQLFAALGQPLPIYAHIAPIGKMDGSSKRKLSKRKDPEAAVGYYHVRGYPDRAIREYLMHIASSFYEDWRTANPDRPIEDFPLRLDQMSVSIALFDQEKLDSISRDIIAGYSPEETYDGMLAWARRHDAPLAAILAEDPQYTQRVFNIANLSPAKRKDLACWSDFHRVYAFFLDELFTRSAAGGYLMPTVAPADVAAIMERCIEIARALPEREPWLQAMRAMAGDLGFAANAKALKQAPDRFKGVFGDVMMVVRVALANQHQTPDLYDMLVTMGPERAARRFAQAREWAIRQQR